MAIFYILGCMFLLSNMYEMRPQYDRHHILRRQPITEKWVYEEPTSFEAPTSLREQPSQSYIQMNDQPIISDSIFNEENQDVMLMYPPRNKDALYYDNDAYERIQMPLEQPRSFYQALLSRAGDIITEQIDKTGGIIFPELNSADKLFVPPVGKLGPACALGGTFCEDLDPNIVYPTDHVIKKVEEKPEVYKEHFLNDISYPIDVSQRIDNYDKTPICPAHEYIVYPKLAQNNNDDWRFIVNTEKLRQGIRIEKCINSDEIVHTDLLPIGTVITCEQRYMNRKLESLKENGDTYSDTFKLPSCCKAFKKTVPVGMRMGGLQNPIKLKQ